jgi:hypothetical protein
MPTQFAVGATIQPPVDQFAQPAVIIVTLGRDLIV